MTGMRRVDRDFAKERMLFGLLLLLQTSLYAWLILDRRLMKAHDTLFEYQLQYLFLGHACQSSDLALWFPCSLHGVISNWFAAFQGGLSQNVILLAGGVPEGTSMLPVFYLGLFVDEVVLLVGIWCLARKYYDRATTRFFVAAAVLGSTFWATHFSFNLRIFYGVPLLLALIHQFLEDGRRWPLWIAANFSALQFSGTITYIPILTLTVVLTYFLIHALMFPALWSERFRDLRPRPRDLMIVLVNAGVLLCVYAVFSDGGAAIRHHRPGRAEDASVMLDSFLTYAGTLSPGRYADFFLGASPSMDYTLYCGICVPILALVALVARPGKAVLHLALCVLLLLLFSMGFLSPVAVAAYEFVPPLRYFRYVSLAAPLVKLFLILLSGYGLEALAQGKLWRTTLMKAAWGPVMLALSAISILLLLVLGGGDIHAVLGTGSSGLAGRPETTANVPVVVTGAFTLLLGAVLFLTERGSLSINAGVTLLLLLETADVYRWKVNLFREETVTLDDAQVALQRIRPLPFATRRSADYEASERYRTLKPILSEYGARYDLIDGYCHVDPPQSRYMIHYWMPPYESLIQASNHLPPDRKLERLPAFRKQALASAGDPYSKVVGVAADKIQVFREAHVPGSDQAIADLLNHPDFKGDVLLLSPRPDDPASSADPVPLRPELLTANERIDAGAEILHFDMNVLSLKVQLPPGPAGGWLFYSDVWNPGWTATVNEKAVPVERAFLAYKAVRLEPGANAVTFRFRAPVRMWAYRVVGLSSLFCLAACVVLAFRLQSDPAFFSISRLK